MLAWPNLRATLAIETPANNSKDAWVWRRPWIETTGIFADLQCRANIAFTVELKTGVLPFTKTG